MQRKLSNKAEEAENTLLNNLKYLLNNFASLLHRGTSEEEYRAINRKITLIKGYRSAALKLEKEDTVFGGYPMIGSYVISTCLGPQERGLNLNPHSKLSDYQAATFLLLVAERFEQELQDGDATLPTFESEGVL